MSKVQRCDLIRKFASCTNVMATNECGRYVLYKDYKILDERLRLSEEQARALFNRLTEERG